MSQSADIRGEPACLAAQANGTQFIVYRLAVN